MFTIQVKPRDAKKGLSFLRESGLLPAVFYGAGKKSTPIVLDEREFEKIWKKAGESTTVTIKTPEGDVDALIHEVTMDPVKGNPIHVDFLVVDMNKTIQVGIPLEFTGVSEAVKRGLGVLVKVLHEIEIEALPKNLPHEIMVDVSKLATTDDQILVKDLIMPNGVKAITDGDEVVAAIAIQKEEGAEVSGPTDLSQIEVEKKGKKEEETEA